MENLVIIPTYNERGNVAILIEKIFGALPEINVLVVDDNSPDGTADEVRRVQKAYPRLDLFVREKKQGLGKAYIDAFAKVLVDARLKKIITMDADLSHDPAYLPAMLRLAAGYNLVVGSRYAAGGATSGWELWRRVMSRGGNFYCKIVTQMPVADCTSGFNVISAELLRGVDFSQFDLSGYAFLIELKHALHKVGGKIAEHPIVFKNRTGGESKISNHIIREGLWAPWKLRFKKTLADVPCRLCQSKKTRHFTKKNGFDLYKCPQCGLLFVWPLPLSTGQLYSTDYFAGAKGGHGYVDYDLDKQAMLGAFHSYLDKLERLAGRKKTLLDVGAATGFFLEIAAKRGWGVSGVEISDFAARKGREKGLDIRSGTLSEASFADESFDAVTMLDVIEHLENPASELREIHRLLRPGGLLLVNTPDAGSLYARLLGKKWHSIVPPEHLIYFNSDNLARLLRESGFQIAYKGKLAKKFSVQYIAQILANWLKIGAARRLAAALSRSKLGQRAFPINLRDNFLVVARKN